MTNDVKNAMEAVQSLPPMARKMTANNIIKNVERLLELRRLVKIGNDSLKKHGGMPMEKVFSDMKMKHGL
jgi:hypothetical protein